MPLAKKKVSIEQQQGCSVSVLFIAVPLASSRARDMSFPPHDSLFTVCNIQPACDLLHSKHPPYKLQNRISFNQASLVVGKKQARLVYTELKLLGCLLCPRDDFFTSNIASLYATRVSSTGVVSSYGGTWTARDSQVTQTGARTGSEGR